MYIIGLIILDIDFSKINSPFSIMAFVISTLLAILKLVVGKDLKGNAKIVVYLIIVLVFLAGLVPIMLPSHTDGKDAPDKATDKTITVITLIDGSPVTNNIDVKAPNSIRRDRSDDGSWKITVTHDTKNIAIWAAGVDGLKRYKAAETIKLGNSDTTIQMVLKNGNITENTQVANPQNPPPPTPRKTFSINIDDDELINRIEAGGRLRHTNAGHADYRIILTYDPSKLTFYNSFYTFQSSKAIVNINDNLAHVLDDVTIPGHKSQSKDDVTNAAIDEAKQMSADYLKQHPQILLKWLK